MNSHCCCKLTTHYNKSRDFCPTGEALPLVISSTQGYSIWHRYAAWRLLFDRISRRNMQNEIVSNQCNIVNCKNENHKLTRIFLKSFTTRQSSFVKFLHFTILVLKNILYITTYTEYF